MARTSELPELIKEFTDMSREYLLQETVEPAKQLGKFAGFSMGAAFAFALGTLFLAIAGTRWIVRAMPDGPNWTALGYIVSVAALALIAFVIVWFTARDSGS